MIETFPTNESQADQEPKGLMRALLQAARARIEAKSEREAAYKQLYDTCTEAFTTHADRIKQVSDTVERLYFHSSGHVEMPVDRITPSETDDETGVSYIIRLPEFRISKIRRSPMQGKVVYKVSEDLVTERGEYTIDRYPKHVDFNPLTGGGMPTTSYKNTRQQPVEPEKALDLCGGLTRLSTFH